MTTVSRVLGNRSKMHLCCGTSWSLSLVSSLAIVGAFARVLPASAGAMRALDTARIEQLTGAKGTLDTKEGVFKVSVPRTDLSIIVAGTRLSPAMGLTSWAAFMPNGRSTMVMGNMVLSENQVNPVIDAALGHGLEVTALHNHFLWDQPRVMFMHIGGHGDESTLATAVGKVFAKIKETAAVDPGPPAAAPEVGGTGPDPAKLDAILGQHGTLAAGVYKVVVGRATTMNGMKVGNAMGVNTWAAFAGSADKAVVDGDFAMLETELQGVLKALRAAGINIVAIHQHMAGEQPRILFLHFWGVGRAEDLAKGLRAALDRTASMQNRRDATAPGGR